MPTVGPLTAGATVAIANSGGDKNGSYLNGGTWTNPAYGAVADGQVANSGSAASGVSSDLLKSSGHGFALPSTAQIVGILVEIKYTAYGSFSRSTYLPKGTGKSSGVLQGNGYYAFGGATDLWGATNWTPADINAASFGASLQFTSFNSNGSGYDVDSFRITVYWQTAPADVPKRYQYKVYRGGLFLGLLPQPKNRFKLPQEINTAGSQITVEVPVSVDTSGQPSSGAITDESGEVITDEAGNPLLTEGAVNLVSLGTGNSLIKNGNQIVVIEVSYYYPNGRVAFSGLMERWETVFGGTDGDNSISIMCYSDGSDMDNFLLLGSSNTYTVDQAQTSQNTSNSLSGPNDKFSGYNYYGQSWTVGAGVTNISAILVKLNGSGNLTLKVYDGPNMTTLLSTATLAVNTGGVAQDVQFNLPARVITAAGAVRFFTLTIDTGSITIYMQNTDVYPGGSAYNANYGGGSGGGAWAVLTGYDLYFKTFSSPGSTLADYPAQDPTTGIANAFMTDYKSRGGKISIATMQATGLSLPWKFNTQTVYEGLQSMLSICPAGFYYTVDVANAALTFKQSSTTADLLLVKGRHIAALRLAASIENVANNSYVSGGQVSGANIYGSKQDATSLGLYGQRLDRRSENRAITTAQVAAIAKTAVDTQKDEQYQTTVKVTDRYINTATIKNGMTVSFRGYGTFVDSLVLRIVRVEYEPDLVTLTLGALPPRLNLALEQITRGLLAQQTIANPSVPS